MAAASVWAFFNEVCQHFVHPATSARESASLRGFDLLLPGLHLSLLESASSEVVASPGALAARWRGEEAGAGDGCRSKCYSPGAGGIFPVELKSRPVELKKKRKGK